MEATARKETAFAVAIISFILSFVVAHEAPAQKVERLEYGIVTIKALITIALVIVSFSAFSQEREVKIVHIGANDYVITANFHLDNLEFVFHENNEFTLVDTVEFTNYWDAETSFHHPRTGWVTGMSFKSKTDPKTKGLNLYFGAEENNDGRVYIGGNNGLASLFVFRVDELDFYDLEYLNDKYSIVKESLIDKLF